MKQDTTMQVQMGTSLAYKLGFKEEDIVIIQDQGVSSLKLTAQERPGLVDLRNLIYNNQVHTLIVYDRDRIARNMVEYLSFIDILTKKNVTLHFSNPAAENFSLHYSREAQLALDAENEGKKIVSRTTQASKYYPLKIYGYDKLGSKGTTRYEFNAEEILVVQSIFTEFITVDTTEQYQKMNARYKNIGLDLYKLLTNPYYSAHLMHEDYNEPLNHIESIISVQTIRENIKKLASWGYLNEKKTEKTAYFVDKTNLKVKCALCTAPISIQIKGNQKSIKCPNHPKIKIDINRLEEILKDHIHTTLSNIDHNSFKHELESKMDHHLQTVRNSIAEQQLVLNNLEQNFRINKINQRKVKELLQNMAEIELSISEARLSITALSTLKDDIERLSMMIMDRCYNEVVNDLIVTINAFIDSIELSYNHVQINTRFSKFLKGAS